MLALKGTEVVSRLQEEDTEQTDGDIKVKMAKQRNRKCQRIHR